VAATPTAAASTATSFSLHGSVAGGVTQGPPGAVVIVSFVAKNTGINVGPGTSGNGPALYVMPGGSINTYGVGTSVTDCIWDGNATGGGDGPGACEPGSWAHGQTIATVFAVALGSVLGPATVKACVYSPPPYTPTYGPCVTLTVKVT
jgi:hypothetical protein